MRCPPTRVISKRNGRNNKCVRISNRFLMDNFGLVKSFARSPPCEEKSRVRFVCFFHDNRMTTRKTYGNFNIYI